MNTKQYESLKVMAKESSTYYLTITVGCLPTYRPLAFQNTEFEAEDDKGQQVVVVVSCASRWGPLPCPYNQLTTFFVGAAQTFIMDACKAFGGDRT